MLAPQGTAPDARLLSLRLHSENPMRPQSDPSSSSSSSFDAWQAATDHNRQSSSQSGKRTHSANGLRVLSRQPSANPLNFTQATDYLDDDDGDDEADDQHVSVSPLNFTQATDYRDQDDGNDEADQWQGLKFERHQLRALQDLVAEINRADHVDLAKTLELFNRIKHSDKAMKTLASLGNADDQDQLRRFGGSVCTCITNLERFLQTGGTSKLGITIDGKFEASNTLLETLSATDVRGACNGMATLFDEDLQSKLFSKAQLTKVGAPLRKLNDALLLQAMAAGLPRDLPSNGCLVDILNLQSRLLKGKLLGSDSKYPRAIFARSIDIFGEWAATSGKVVSDDGVVVSRQLGKVFVQLNTIRSFGLIRLDKSETGKKNRRVLGQLAIALGSAEALDELTSKPGPANRDGSPGAAIRVAPNGVEVTNISNTIKDFLDAGFLSIGDEKVQDILRRLMTLVTEIPPSTMLKRSAQTLANCANLVRSVYECAIRPGASAAILQSPEFSAAARHLLQLSASANFWREVEWFGKPEQTLANLGSFIKAMDKWGKVGIPLMRSATSCWAAQLRALEVDAIFDGSSVASMLSALVALHELAPGAQLPALIEQFLGVASGANSAKWEGRSRALALRAALAWTPAKGSPNAGLAIDALLAAGPHQEDSLPYLQAILMRSKQDMARLPGFEKMLRQLLPQRPANDLSPIELSDIESEIKRRAAKEAPPAVREPEPVAPASAPQAAPAEPKPAARKLVGETSIVEKKVANTAFTDNASPTGSGKKDDPQGAAGSGKRADEWSQAKKTIRPPRTTAAITTLSSTVPKVTPRENTATVPRKPGLQVSSSVSTAVEKNSTSENQAKTASVSAAKSQVKSGTTKNTGAAQQNNTAPASQPLNAKTRAALEKQWFDAIRNPGMKARMTRLEEMLARDVTLLTYRNKQHQQPLFYAITNGDKDLVGWLLDRMTPEIKDEALGLLPMIFAAPVLVGNDVIAALDAFLSKLDKSAAVLTQLKNIFFTYRASIPRAYHKVLESWLPEDNKLRSEIINEVIPPTQSSTGARIDVAADNRDHSESALFDRLPDLPKDQLKVIIGYEAGEDGRHPFLSKIYLNDPDSVEQFLNYPAAPRLLRTGGSAFDMTPLALAAFLNRAEILEKILRSSEGLASALDINRFGYTPLHFAVEMESEDAVKALLKAPNATQQIRISRPDDPNLTPVYKAVYVKNAQLLRMLLEVPGAEDLVLLPGPHNLTPLQAAIVNNDAACAAELLRLQNVELQLKAQDPMGRNVLASSLQEDALAVGKLMLQRPEAAMLIREHFGGGLNVLTLAASVRDEKTVELLLESPFAEWLAADATYDGNNALMCSTMNPNATSLRIAERLLSLKNAEQQATSVNKHQQNALLMATEKGLIDLVRKLISLPNAKLQARVRCEAMNESLDEILQQSGIWRNPDQNPQRAFADRVIFNALKEQDSTFPLPPGMPKRGVMAYSGKNAFELAKTTGQTEIAKMLQPFEDS